MEDWLALGDLLITRDTVATETPASLATSFMVAMGHLLHWNYYDCEY
jgi:hypothetical protein